MASVRSDLRAPNCKKIFLGGGGGGVPPPPQKALKKNTVQLYYQLSVAKAEATCLLEEMDNENPLFIMNTSETSDKSFCYCHTPGT